MHKEEIGNIVMWINEFAGLKGVIHILNVSGVVEITYDAGGHWQVVSPREVANLVRTSLTRCKSQAIKVEPLEDVPPEESNRRTAEACLRAAITGLEALATWQQTRPPGDDR